MAVSMARTLSYRAIDNSALGVRLLISSNRLFYFSLKNWFIGLSSLTLGSYTSRNCPFLINERLQITLNGRF